MHYQCLRGIYRQGRDVQRLFLLAPRRLHGRADRRGHLGLEARRLAALGLGLPLTQQFIEAHGGTVELESKKGEGTTVTLSIPRGTR